MKKFLVFLPILAAAGCFATKPPVVVNWGLEPSLTQPALCESPKFGESRLAIVSVRSPYDSRNLVVRRKDGSTAFDPLNAFASTPSALIKGSALDILRSTGVFKGVQPAVTTADIRDMLELVVDDLSLDCRQEGARLATAKVVIAHLVDRRVTGVGRGQAQVDAAGGNYAQAFGAALEQAMRQALSQLVK